MVARVRKRDGEAKVQGDRLTEGIRDNRNSAFRVRKANKEWSYLPVDEDVR